MEWWYKKMFVAALIYKSFYKEYIDDRNHG